MNAAPSRVGIKPVKGVIHGEVVTGYEAPKGLGEYECENCSFYRESDSSCGQVTMKALSKQPRTQDGRVKVDPEACCSYVDRLGKIEEHEAEEMNAD